MSTTHRDLVVRSGTTLGAVVQYETPGTATAVNTLLAGDRVFHEGAPWAVFANTVTTMGRQRLRLGTGQWYEPDLILDPAATLPLAVARHWDTVAAYWRDPYGQRRELPTEVDPDGVTLVLVPHTDTARAWSRDLGHIIDGTVTAPAPPDGVLSQVWRLAYDYDLNATFTDLEGTQQVLEGALVVQPSVAEPDAAPLMLSRPGHVDLYVYRGDSGQVRVTITDPAGAPVDVSTATWAAEIRSSTDAPTAMATLDVVPVVGIPNAVDVVLTAEVSATLTSSGVWDLELTMDGSVTTVVAGNVILTKDVTP